MKPYTAFTILRLFHYSLFVLPLYIFAALAGMKLLPAYFPPLRNALTSSFHPGINGYLVATCLSGFFMFALIRSGQIELLFAHSITPLQIATTTSLAMFCLVLIGCFLAEMKLLTAVEISSAVASGLHLWMHFFLRHHQHKILIFLLTPIVILALPLCLIAEPMEFMTTVLLLSCAVTYSLMCDRRPTLVSVLHVDSSLVAESNIKTTDITSELASKKEQYNIRPITLLFLASDPTDAQRLRIGEEFRQITDKIRHAGLEDAFVIKTQFSTRVSDLQECLLRTQPHLVHFSGHGSLESELLFENEHGKSQSVSRPAFVNLLKLIDCVKVVFLNACNSAEHARECAEVVDCAIGMHSPIEDDSAIAFSYAFYRALAHGRSIKNAFDLGINEISLLDIPDENAPQLFVMHGLDPDFIYFSVTGGKDGGTD